MVDSRDASAGPDWNAGLMRCVRASCCGGGDESPGVGLSVSWWTRWIMSMLCSGDIDVPGVNLPIGPRYTPPGVAIAAGGLWAGKPSTAACSAALDCRPCGADNDGPPAGLVNVAMNPTHAAGTSPSLSLSLSPSSLSPPPALPRRPPPPLSSFSRVALARPRAATAGVMK